MSDELTNFWNEYDPLQELDKELCILEKSVLFQERIRFLHTVKKKTNPPLNTTDRRVVELFNELLAGVQQLSQYEFELKAEELFIANGERASAYVDDMLDEVGVYDGHARRRAAELILTPTPHERANAARLREFFLYVKADRFIAWKTAVAERHGKHVKVVWKEHRNPYRPGNIHDSLYMP